MNIAGSLFGLSLYEQYKKEIENSKSVDIEEEAKKALIREKYEQIKAKEKKVKE